MRPDHKLSRFAGISAVLESSVRDLALDKGGQA